MSDTMLAGRGPQHPVNPYNAWSQGGSLATRSTAVEGAGAAESAFL